MSPSHVESIGSREKRSFINGDTLAFENETSYFFVKVNIPVLPTVSAKVTFTNFERKDDLKDDLFVIPPSYMLDPNR